jgi:hypothetical protein
MTEITDLKEKINERLDSISDLSHLRLIRNIMDHPLETLKKHFKDMNRPLTRSCSTGLRSYVKEVELDLDDLGKEENAPNP